MQIYILKKYVFAVLRQPWPHPAPRLAAPATIIWILFEIHIVQFWITFDKHLEIHFNYRKLWINSKKFETLHNNIYAVCFMQKIIIVQDIIWFACYYIIVLI